MIGEIILTLFGFISLSGALWLLYRPSSVQPSPTSLQTGVFALAHGLLMVAGIIGMVAVHPLPLAVWAVLAAAALAARVWNGFSMYGRPRGSHVTVNIVILAVGVYLTLPR